MKLPTTFSIDKKKWIIKYVDEYLEEKNLDGEIDFDNREIHIRKVSRKYPKKEAISTLIHEFCHLVFMEVGREDLCYDENLVKKLEIVANKIFRSLK
jgi:predicted metal-dependent hydrolase